MRSKIAFCYFSLFLGVKSLFRRTRGKSFVGVEEILCGFVHIDSESIFVLEAEIHIEYSEVVVDGLYSNKELLRLYPSTGCGALIVVPLCKL